MWFNGIWDIHSRGTVVIWDPPFRIQHGNPLSNPGWLSVFNQIFITSSSLAPIRKQRLWCVWIVELRPVIRNHKSSAKMQWFKQLLKTQDKVNLKGHDSEITYTPGSLHKLLMFEHCEKNMANAIPTDTFITVLQKIISVLEFLISHWSSLLTQLSLAVPQISLTIHTKSNNVIFCCTNRLLNYSRNRGCMNKEDLYEKITRRENGKGVVCCITHKHIPRLLQP